MYELRHYLTPSGDDPFQLWLEGLKDAQARARILVRLNRLAAGSFGDCKPVGQGVWELRVDHGPGYRVYYGLIDKRVVLILIGGDKRRQQSDIAQAISFWAARIKDG